MACVSHDSRESTPRDSGREPFPREFGRDGVSGLVTLDRAMRARDVSRPSEQDFADAHAIVEQLIARADGRTGRGRS